MKLELIRIQNFRAIERLELRPHPQLTVLHGDNAHGKTSVLSAIATGLGAIPTALPGGVASLRLRKNDGREGSEYTRVLLKTTDEVVWEQRLGRLERDREPNRDILPYASSLRDLKDWLGRTASGAAGHDTELPLAAYYDTDRAVVDAIGRKRGRKAVASRYLALSGALAAKTSFRELFEWFYEKENEELREQKKDHRSLDYELNDLSAVRSAITSMVPSISKPRVEMRPKRFVVSERLGERTEERSLGELSGGCRAVLALAGDLARRMAQGNPHLADPLHSEAVVLIDEVDLHLHPSWQQRILRDLTRTFPNAQFIVSTHSPQVLTTVKPEQVVELHREDGAVAASRSAATTYGAEAGDVLVTVMGVKARPANDFTGKLDEYLGLVGRGNGTSQDAKALRKELEELSPQDPALDRADMEMARQAAIGGADS